MKIHSSTDPIAKTHALLRATLALALSAVLPITALAGGGNVQPPTAKPLGYSLKDMAKELAYFTTSGNDVARYPDTPFQILYVDYSTGTNTFSDVKPGTHFFVPVLNLTDSTPIIGDFPANASAVEEYVFGEHQLGAHDIEIEVDGKVTPLGLRYVAGPVRAPGLLDAIPGGVPGSHYIQVGAFLTPLSKGTHSVTIRAALDGDAIFETFGVEEYAFEITYEVIVVR